MKRSSFEPLPIALLLIVITTGVFFRVARLDYKVYWHDEVFTSLRVSGFTGQEVGEALFTGDMLRPDDLLQFQTLQPGRGLGDTFYALSTHPEHPPLYYILLRFWMELFGTSIAAVRSLSVFFSLLTFPALYWLCLELFKSSAVGWMAIALYSVSPFHVLYAQEARQYSLWTLATILSSIMLLRALEKGTVSRWISYGVTIAVGLYTSLFFVLVCAVQGIYTFIHETCRFNKTVLSFAIALSIGAATGIPWMIVMLQNWDAFKAKTAWVTHSYDLPVLAKLWGLHFSSTFVDSGLPLDHPYNYIAPPLIIVVLGVAFYQLIRKTPQRVWVFVLLLTLLPAIALILPDLTMGGRRSASTRYFVPALIGALLAVAFLLAHGLSHLNQRNRWVTQAITALLLTAGIISCGISFSSNTWWNKVVSYGIPRSADQINAKPNPLVIAGLRDVSLGNSISLSYWLDDHVRLQMLLDPEIPPMPMDISDRFLFYPSDSLIQAFENAPEFMLQPLGRDSMYIIIVNTDSELTTK